jgi:hypothetical protein
MMRGPMSLYTFLGLSHLVCEAPELEQNVRVQLYGLLSLGNQRYAVLWLIGLSEYWASLDPRMDVLLRLMDSWKDRCVASDTDRHIAPF